MQTEPGERDNQERISTEGTTAGILGNVEKQQPTPLVSYEKPIPSTWIQQKRRLIILFLTAIGVFFIVWASSSWQNRTNTQPNGGQEITTTPEEITTTPEARCTSGDAKSCFDLGVMYENGTGVSKDQVHAAQLYKQACDGGNAPGCTNLAFMYLIGTGVSKDQVRAAQLYKQACDGGNAFGCSNLGVMYENGTGVSKDQVRAAQLYKQACDGGNALGCNNLKDASKKP